MIKITITNTQGSTPRNSGAELWVNKTETKGSIGGGNLEDAAITHARQMLATGMDHDTTKTILGPESNQCCGGVVELSFNLEKPLKPEQRQLAIFGAGHVGARLARLARVLGYQVVLIDSRSTIQIDQPEPYHATPLPEAALAKLPPKTDVVILTHDHSLDFILAEEALKRADLGFIGMIGSKSKAARFRQHHRSLDTPRLHCPIGIKTDNKHPDAVALAILTAIIDANIIN